ncbi:MAG: hypothetical protein JXQ75_03220 [Phycisphaerae bacterium]|nr:hypothetical protein [Phycisphaerae bacterium]
MRLEETRKQIPEGLEQARSGELVDGEQVFERLEKRSRRLRKKSKRAGGPEVGHGQPR